MIRVFPQLPVPALFVRAAFAACGLLSALLLAVPAGGAGQVAASGGPEIILRGENNAALLTLRPVGGLTFDGASLSGILTLAPTPVESPWIRGTLRGEVQARLQGDRIVLERIRLRMDKAWIAALETASADTKTKTSRKQGAEPSGTVLGLRLTGRGIWSSSGGALHLENARLELGPEKAPLMVLQGSLRWSEAGGLETDFALDASSGKGSAALLAALFPESLQGLTLQGPLQLGLRFAMAGASRDDRSTTQGADISLGLDVRQPVAVALGETRLSLPRLQAELGLRSGSGGQWDAQGRVDVRGTLAPGGVELASPALEFEAGMSGGAYRLRELRLFSAGGLVLAGRKVPLETVTLSGAISPLPDHGWNLEDLRLAFPGGALTASGSVDGNGTVRCAFQGPGLDIAGLAPSLAALSGLEGWSAEGRLDVSGRLDTASGTITSETDFRLRGLNYMSPDALHMGQDLGGRLRLRSRLSLSTLRRWVNADLRLDKGESLFGATYLNLVEHPLHVAANANQIGADRFKDLKAELDWTGFGALRAEGDLWAHGSFADWRYRGEAEASDLNIGALFAAFAAAPYGLTRWQGPDAGPGGRGGFTLAVDADGTIADLNGRLAITDASLRSTEGDVDVRGAYLDLPLTYRLKGPTRPPARSEVTGEQTGMLRIARLKTPWSRRENFAVGMALVPNRFYLLDPIRIPLFGGRIRLDNLRCDEPLSREFNLSLDAGFNDIDLSQWSRESVPLQGVLHGDLGRITATRKRVVIPGTVEGDFFGGSVRADKFFMDWPLEARRQFGADASVRGLDLERLSAALGIGRVTGLLDLDFRNLLIAYGQPFQFQLSAQTSGQGDFEKSVSLRAVNSLSVIGTGSGIGDVGVGLFASFFEEFSYARIGFQCIQNNDRFQVRGLIRDGGVEYLIKKPFLTGINVVNGNPENYISFSDMLERIQRVVKGSASSAP
ncbi:MAG: hypothetical protein AB7E32_05975 [Desulfovibrio sp.]